MMDSLTLGIKLDNISRSLENNDLLNQQLSLLEINRLKDQHKKVAQSLNKKMKLRVIQHFACSGGTIISKCLRGMPNAFLLSELHPTSRLHLKSQPHYSPRDIASQAIYGDLPNIDEINTKAFLSQLLNINQHVFNLGGDLVVRDHTHADFCVGLHNEGGSTILQIIPDSVVVLKVATIRNPIDAYLSLKHNGWIHFSPSGFDDYCRRFLKFLEPYADSNVFKYESFVDDPCEFMKAVCHVLELTYSEVFLDCFSFFKISGDSGRKSSLIEQRPRRIISDEYRKEIEASHYMRKVSELYGYSLS